MTLYDNNHCSPHQAPVIKNIYVAVDACGELGGQPYKLLKALRQLYNITGLRNLYIIDTEQGFHEKSNGTTPEILALFNQQKSSFARFIEENAEWALILPTNTCRHFRQTLATDIFPQIVDPMIAAVELTAAIIKEHAFAILKTAPSEYGQNKIINNPSDIHLHIHINRSNNYVFTDPIVNKAADQAKRFWVESLQKIPAFSADTSKKNEKGYMARMIKSVQELKLYSHAVFSMLEPEMLPLLGHTSPMANYPWIDFNDPTSRHFSHLYENLQLPLEKDFWQKAGAIQAVRLTPLWPWTQKPLLSDMSNKLLDKTHKNTADISYLDLYTNILPHLSPPSETLFVLLTHDAPLIQQLLECSTGIRHTQERIKNSTLKGEGRKKIDVFRQTPIYKQFSLEQRHPCEYPYEAGLGGGEFVIFAYKEILANFKDFIEPQQQQQLLDNLNHHALSNKNSPSAQLLLQTIEETLAIPNALRAALQQAIIETQKLEAAVITDISNMNAISKLGRYAHRKSNFMQQRLSL
ncbi:MAG: hypothetical protein ACOYK8_05325 [Alphaproteobacteria bacterium]